MKYMQQELSFLLDTHNVTHKWFNLPDSIALNIYDQTVDACLFAFVLDCMRGEFVSIHRTSEFIQVKRYK